MRIYKMDLMKDEDFGDFNAIQFRSQRRNLRVLEQVGKTNIKVDSKREALMPGKRISKSGNVYWETRKNRSDAKGSKV